MPEYMPFNDPRRPKSLTTVDVPLGPVFTSKLTGNAFTASDLGAVDVPPDYQVVDVTPKPDPPTWAIGSLIWRE